MCLGWRKGVRAAEELIGRRPDRVLLIRYEELCSDTEKECRRICEFCEVPFTPDILSVEQINPAESPYDRTKSGSGITTEKIGYFRSHLCTSEQALVVWLSDRALVARYYPELIAQLDAPNRVLMSTEFPKLAQGLTHIGKDLGRRLLREPCTTVRRFRQRLG